MLKGLRKNWCSCLQLIRNRWDHRLGSISYRLGKCRNSILCLGWSQLGFLRIRSLGKGRRQCSKLLSSWRNGYNQCYYQNTNKSNNNHNTQNKTNNNPLQNNSKITNNNLNRTHHNSHHNSLHNSHNNSTPPKPPHSQTPCSNPIYRQSSTPACPDKVGNGS